jgi:hypothetical protein
MGEAVRRDGVDRHTRALDEPRPGYLRQWRQRRLEAVFHLGESGRQVMTGTRTWVLLPAVVLVLSGLAAGCSSTPAYCTDATNLKTSVSNLSNVDVAKNGLSSLQTALTSVQTNASKFATDAKSAFPSQTAALNTSLTALATTIKSAQGQPPVKAATAVVPAVAQVKTSASTLQSAVSNNCS